MTPSYVVTLEMDPDSFGWLNDLRRDHFPPARSLLDAHLTLFHKVDANGIATIASTLTTGSRDCIALTFSGLRPLGRGVAIAVAAPDLMDLRNRLARPVADHLTPQDRQTFRPHVTIQNKVDPAEARQLMARLGAAFVPRQGRGTAVLIWEYLGGPWRLHARAPLRG
jgi:2'-5' RNA ligase